MYTYIFKFFHLNIFSDPRINVFGFYEGLGHSLIPTTVLSGGVSAWRKEVFDKVGYDMKNNFHASEDFEFSTRVYQFFGKYLYINPNARAQHKPSPINRAILGEKQKRKIVEYIMFYKNVTNGIKSFLALIWLLLGLFLETLYRSIKDFSFSVIFGYFSGLYDGIKKEVKYGID